MSEETMPTGNLFSRVLSEVSHGDLADQASASLEELVKSVRDTNKQGTLTLKITIKPRGRDAGQVEVTGACKADLPVADIAPSMFFATENGELLKDNPAQLQIKFGAPKPISKASNQ